MKEIFNNEREIILNSLSQKLIKDTSIIKNLECEKFYESLLKSNKIIPFRNLNFFSKINKLYLNYSFPIEEYIQYSPNQIYIGSYNIKGNFNGYGILYEIDNNENNNKKIEGFFLDGILNNESRIFTSNKEFYSGKFKNNQLNGEGHFIKNEIEYFGNFLNNLQNGKGKEIYNDNSTFEGLFLNGNKINGKFIWNDGNSYEGEIQNGYMNGLGYFNFNGNKYIGYYNKDLKEGFGAFIWSEIPLKAYIGFWEKGKQNGLGVNINDNIVKYGIWKKGKKEIWLNNEKDIKKYISNNKYEKCFKNPIRYVNKILKIIDDY
jgi:hypothetical protein